MTGKFATDRIFRHGHAGKIIFIDISRRKLRDCKIMEDFEEIKNFLTTLIYRDKFGFRCKQGNRVLVARFPGNGTTVEHQDVTGMGTMACWVCFDIGSPIRIHPSPKHIASVSRVVSVTRVVNRLVQGASKVAKDMLGGSHVFQ